MHLLILQKQKSNLKNSLALLFDFESHYCSVVRFLFNFESSQYDWISTIFIALQHHSGQEKKSTYA